MTCDLQRQLCKRQTAKLKFTPMQHWGFAAANMSINKEIVWKAGFFSGNWLNMIFKIQKNETLISLFAVSIIITACLFLCPLVNSSENSKLAADSFTPLEKAADFSAVRTLALRDAISNGVKERSSLMGFVLDNGLKTICVEKRGNPAVSVMLVIGAGSAEPMSFSETGAAHLTEHMLFQGSRNYKEQQISQTMSALGGYINAYTTFDYTAVHLSVLKEHLNKALEILADMLFNSEFLPEDIEKEKQVVVNEIALNMDDPSQRLVQELFALSFRESSYRHPIIGYKDILAALEREQLYEFYRQFYIPNNMVLAIAGDVDSNETKLLVKQYFGQFQRKQLLRESFIEEPKQITMRQADVDFENPVAKIAFAYHSVDIADEDLFALDALSVICGGMPGSILSDELIEKKRTAFSVNAYNYTPKHDGLFVITIDCKPDLKEEVITDTKNLLKTIREKGIKENQLSKAKNVFLTSYYKSLETNEGLAGDKAVNYTLIGDGNFSDKYLESIKNLTADDLKRAANKYLIDSNLTIVSLYKVSKESLSSAESNSCGTSFSGWENNLSDTEAEKPVLKILPGGIKVILKPDKNTPLVNIQAVYLGGLKSETAPLWGISNLTSALLFEGTKKYDKVKIDSLLSDWGANHSTFSGNNSFGFSMDVINSCHQEALELTEEILLNCTFPEEQIEKQKNILKASLEEEEFDVFKVSYLTAKETLYPQTNPFFHNKLGTKQSLDSIDRKDILAYYKKHLNSKGIVISVFGDFESEKIMPSLERMCRKISAGEADCLPEKVMENEPLPIKEHVVKYLPKEQSVVMTACRSAGIRSNDRYAFEVLTKVLSGGGSRLYEAIRNQKGLSYSLGAFNTYGLEDGFYLIYVETASNGTEEIINSINEQIELLRERDIPDEELDRAKNDIIGNFLRQMQSNSTFAFSCSLDELYGLGFDFYDTYPQRIKEVTGKDVKEVITKYFTKENKVVIVILPSECSELKKSK